VVAMKSVSVHVPRPVSESGVRLRENEVPHGPLNAVMVSPKERPHGSAFTGAAGMGRVSGCPESIRSMSQATPSGVFFHGVWQSLQPPIVTRYFPRAICFGSGLAGSLARAVRATREDTATTRRFMGGLLAGRRGGVFGSALDDGGRAAGRGLV